MIQGMKNRLRHALNNGLSEAVQKSIADGELQKVVKQVAHSSEMQAFVKESVQASLSPAGLQSAIVEAVRSHEFYGALLPHLVHTVYNPDLRGADLPGYASRVDKGTQILLQLKYREMVRTGAPLPSFDDVGFRSFSQFDEDGILLYIFSLIGMTTRQSVEICAGVGFECNTANLIVNHGFYGLLFDGNPDNIQKAKQFYITRTDTLITPPAIVHAWIESDNIDNLIRSNGFQGEIDLLSLDLDGIDYWIMKAIQCVQPRVIVVEYHSAWGPDEAKTVPDQKGFAYSDAKGAYCGASLAAFNKLAVERGYRLVGCNRNRLNAFFVKRGLADDLLPEVSVASCLDHYRIKLHWDKLRPIIAQWDWQDV